MLTKMIRFNNPLVSREDFFGPMETAVNNLLNDMFDSFPEVVKSSGPRGYPKTDIYQDGNDLVLECFVPLIKKENLKAELRDGVLSIVGTVANVDRGRGPSTFFRRELRRSGFERQFVIPEELLRRHTELSATLVEGVLTIRLVGAYTPDPVPPPDVREIEIK